MVLVPLEEDDGGQKEVLLRRLKSLIEEISKEERVDKRDLLDLLESQDAFIPVSAFENRDLGILEVAVKYLMEEENRTLTDVARLLNRDRRTIWSTYHFSKKKSPGKLVVDRSQYFIPVAAFTKRDLGVLESVTVYLREEKALGFTQIGRLLRRDTRTIWTAYSRVKKRNGK